MVGRMCPLKRPSRIGQWSSKFLSNFLSPARSSLRHCND